MSLTSEEVIANFTTYVKLGKKYKFVNDELINFLGESFMKAPLSTSNKTVNAFEGGLIDYLVKLTKVALSVSDTLVPAKIKPKNESIIKVCLLHQIGKAKLYLASTDEWRIKNLGENYVFNDDVVSMKVGERSAFYAMSHGVSLTEEEISAIYNFDKDDTDLASKYHNSVLGYILKTANTYTRIQIENE